jgi:AraC-like DNA-binding protein
MKLRQSLHQRILNQPRQVEIGEVDGEIDWAGMSDMPSPAWNERLLRRCARIHERFALEGRGSIPRGAFADVPLWIYLEYAVQFGGMLLHGSRTPNLVEIPPVRLSTNLQGWNRFRHFANGNATEAMFCALLATERLAELDCTRKSMAVGGPTGSKLFIGIDYRALPFAPWAPGFVYLVERKRFAENFLDRPFLSPQPIRPVAQIEVRPPDWPFLSQVSGVDVVEVCLRNRETYLGYPWVSDDEVHPHLSRRATAESVRAYLLENLDRPVALDELADRSGVSPFKLLRIYQSRFGLSPREAHLSLRLDRVKHMISGGAQIGAAACDGGFSDQAHLTRLFHQEFGITPARYVRAQESSRD